MSRQHAAHDKRSSESVPEEMRHTSQAAADVANATLGRATGGGGAAADGAAAGSEHELLHHAHAEPHHDSVPEALRHTSEAAADLANAVMGALHRRRSAKHHEEEEQHRESGRAMGAGAGAGAREHHRDSVPESLRHTSEAAAELANAVLQRLSGQLRRGHELRTPGPEQPHSTGGPGGGSGGGGGGGRVGTEE